jgi:hypothetical protein
MIDRDGVRTGIKGVGLNDDAGAKVNVDGGSKARLQLFEPRSSLLPTNGLPRGAGAALDVTALAEEIEKLVQHDSLVWVCINSWTLYRWSG